MSWVQGKYMAAKLLYRQAGGAFPVGLPVFDRTIVSGVGAVF